jgi:membrane protease YdiL (CAAX protease family)
MPSAAESIILLYVMLAVLASVPVAVLWHRHAQRASRVPGMPPLPEMITVHGVRTPMPPWGRADAWFAVALAFLVAVLLGPGAAAAAAGEGAEQVKQEFTAGLFAVQIVAQALLIGMVVAWVVVFRRFQLRLRFGFIAQPWWRSAGMAALGLVLCWVVLGVVVSATQPLLHKLAGVELSPQSLVQQAPDITDPLARVLMVVTLCIGAPVMEEFIFRGVLYSVAARFTHPLYACAASSVLFGVIHGNLMGLLPLSVLGVLFVEAYRRSGTLLVPILMHAGYNLTTFILLTVWPEIAKN